MQVAMVDLGRMPPGCYNGNVGCGLLEYIFEMAASLTCVAAMQGRHVVVSGSHC